jgi:hypothetical protein
VSRPAKPTKHDLDWALIVYAIRGPGYDSLPSFAQNRMLIETWRHTDAYGEVGLVPPQGWDWSGIRDSSREALAKIAQAARGVLEQAGARVPTKAELTKTAAENLRKRAEVEAMLREEGLA